MKIKLSNPLAEDKTYNAHLFKSEELWENYDPNGAIAQKVITILERIPDDTHNILDVGCGNGIITNRLAERYEVSGVDNSAEALSYLESSSILASCDDIPVEDNSFDMVFSSELLEHLNDEMLTNTLNEFKRISRKYIMIAVPNQEQLSRSYVLCPNCNNEFHIYGHIQTYTPERLGTLIGSEYELQWSTTLGHKVKYFLPPLLSLKQKTFGQYFPTSQHTICPNCQNREFAPPPKNLFTKVINASNKVLSGKGKRYWLLTLLKKS